MDEPLTKSLERYDVLDRIAVGGMAEVFLAKAYGAHGFEKTLAIKRILPELARDPEFEARFIAEAKVAVRLSHANVVQVLDFGRIGESLFIAMEFVDGLDLAAMLRKFKDEKRLVPLPAAFHIAIEIVRALDFAHGHNVVHRDVSPSNVLVSRAGEVKIADFGIAVAAQPHSNSGPGPKRVMGKWRYMSPEQTRGDTLDTRSDLFSAASVIFELFTGEKLFPGDEAEDIIKNIHNMPIPRMTSMRPGLPSRLDEVLAGPLARKPIDRPIRPAAILRSLIELSYESSIMATALDVADALATVIPAKRIGGSGALDDVIRKQLHEQSVARRTAITDGKPPSTEDVERAERAERGEVSTGLFRKIDIDGLARLEEVDAATRVAAPRAKRQTSQGDAMPGALYDASRDRDRHTEVGGPPTGQVPRVGDSLNAMKPVTETTVGGERPKRWVWVLVALVIAALGSLAIWGLMRSPGIAATVDAATVVTPPPPVDAPAPVETRASLTILSYPAGATVTFGDRVAGPAPQKASVPAGVPIHVRLELKGHETIEADYTLNAGERLTIEKTLIPAQAVLHVETTPPGAQVTYNNQQICAATPCDAKLGAAKDAEIVLTKDKHDTVRTRVALVAGETARIVQTLREVPKFGYVAISVTGVPVWAMISHNGRNLGISTGAGGAIPYQLPVGRQTLVLTFKTERRTLLAVDVVEGKTINVPFSWK